MLVISGEAARIEAMGELACRCSWNVGVVVTGCQTDEAWHMQSLEVWAGGGNVPG